MTSYAESAAKPRDLQRELAMAAQQNLTTRKSIADHMQVSSAWPIQRNDIALLSTCYANMQMATPDTDTAVRQPDQEAGQAATKRARLSVPQRQAVISSIGRQNHIHKAVRPSDTPAGREALQDRHASISNDLQAEVELGRQAIIELRHKLELSRQANVELQDELAKATKSCEDRGRRSHTASQLWQGEKKTSEAQVAKLKAELHAAAQGARDAKQRAQQLQQQQVGCCCLCKLCNLASCRQAATESCRSVPMRMPMGL